MPNENAAPSNILSEPAEKASAKKASTRTSSPAPKTKASKKEESTAPPVPVQTAAIEVAKTFQAASMTDDPAPSRGRRCGRWVVAVLLLCALAGCVALALVGPEAWQEVKDTEIGAEVKDTEIGAEIGAEVKDRANLSLAKLAGFAAEATDSVRLSLAKLAGLAADATDSVRLSLVQLAASAPH